MLIRNFVLLILLICSFSFQASAQCTVDCVNSLEVILDENGSYTLDLSKIIQSTTGGCSTLDSLEVIPKTLNCSFAGARTPFEVRNLKTDQDVCSGVLEVKDTSSPKVLCLDQIKVYIPANRSTQKLYQQDFYITILDNCNRSGIFDYSPRSVDCSDIGLDQTFFLRTKDGLDTLCTGTVQVFDTTATRVHCLDSLSVDLPVYGFGAFVFPPDIMIDYSDNCVRQNAFILRPTLLLCDKAGDNPYSLIERSTGDTICTGVITLRDPILPEVSCLENYTVYLSSDGTDVQVLPRDLVTEFSDNCGTVDDLVLTPGTDFSCQDAGASFAYGLYPPGDTVELCSGTIAVVDTFSSALQCQENVIVSLPLTDDGFRLSPEILVNIDDNACLSLDRVKVVPEAVYCYNAGQEIRYQLLASNNGDTLCTGVLSVENTTETVISCRDSVQIKLPNTGRAYRVIWRDVVLDFSDNCLNLNDLEFFPGFLDCRDAGNWFEYQVRSRVSRDILCSGVLQPIEENPLVVDCLDTIEVEIGPTGFPAFVFPGNVIESINNNCSRYTDFRVSPTFFFCPDPGASFSLRNRYTGVEVCTGTVVVRGKPSPFGSCPDPDGFAANTTSGLSLNSTAQWAASKMMLYPNPSHGAEITLVLPVEASKMVQYRIFSITGKEMSQGRLEYLRGGVQVPVNLIPSGTYIIQAVLPGGERYSERFIRSND